ncbi:MAG: hypothetical protein RL681_757 [Candidatus Parcubacteria bacterium]|jgi:hypothetical protein
MNMEGRIEDIDKAHEMATAADGAHTEAMMARLKAEKNEAVAARREALAGRIYDLRQKIEGMGSDEEVSQGLDEAIDKYNSFLKTHPNIDYVLSEEMRDGNYYIPDRADARQKEFVALAEEFKLLDAAAEIFIDEDAVRVERKKTDGMSDEEVAKMLQEARDEQAAITKEYFSIRGRDGGYYPSMGSNEPFSDAIIDEKRAELRSLRRKTEAFGRELEARRSAAN